jgi:hypothetical protein
MSTAQNPTTIPPLRSVPGRRRWPTIVLMIVVFIAGVALGVGTSVLYYDQINQYYRNHPEKFPDRFTARLRDRLDLSSDQTRQVREIVAQRWPALQEARRQAYPIFKPQLDQVDQQISALLNDRQKPKWNEYFASIRRMYNPAPAAPSPPASQPAEAATPPVQPAN